MNSEEIYFKKIPTDTFISISYLQNKTLLNKILTIVLNNCNDKLSYKTNVLAKFTGFQDLLRFSEIKEIFDEIKEYSHDIYPHGFIANEVWGNVYEKEDYAKPHTHIGASAFCGIIYLSDGGPGTYFPQYNLTVSEEFGKVVLFHPCLIHEVKKSNLQNRRVTLAFNCQEIKKWDD